MTFEIGGEYKTRRGNRAWVIGFRRGAANHSIVGEEWFDGQWRVRSWGATGRFDDDCESPSDLMHPPPPPFKGYANIYDNCVVMHQSRASAIAMATDNCIRKAVYVKECEPDEI